MKVQALALAGLVVLCATAAASKVRYAVKAPRDRLESETLELREILMSHGLTSIEKSFTDAAWTKPDGSDADCLDTQLVVTINQVQLAGYPAGGLAGRVLTEPLAMNWLVEDNTPDVPFTPPHADAPLQAVLKRVAAGTSTYGDAMRLAAALDSHSRQAAA